MSDEQSTVVTVKSKRFSRKQRVLIPCAVIVVILVVSVAWLFLSGRLVFVDNQTTGAPHSAQSRVCDSAIVETYNYVIQYVVRSEGESPSIDTAGLESLISEITQQDGYADDPTCQTILFWAAISDEDPERAQSAYEAVKRLHERDLFADNNLRANAPLFTYEAIIASISQTDQDSQGSASDE